MFELLSLEVFKKCVDVLRDVVSGALLVVGGWLDWVILGVPSSFGYFMIL